MDCASVIEGNEGCVRSSEVEGSQSFLADLRQRDKPFEIEGTRVNSRARAGQAPIHLRKEGATGAPSSRCGEKEGCD